MTDVVVAIDCAEDLADEVLDRPQFFGGRASISLGFEPGSET